MVKKFKFSQKLKKIILGICIGTAILLTIGLFTYIYIVDTQTLGRRISVYGTDVSVQTVEQAVQTIRESFQNRKVLFKEDGTDIYQTTLSNLGYDLDESFLRAQLQELQNTRKSEKRILPAQEDYSPAYQVVQNAEQEKNVLQNSDINTKERTESVNAAVQYDQQQKKYILIKDVQGNQIDQTKFLNYIDEILDSNFRLKLLGGDIQITIDVNVYQQPVSVVSAEMEQKVTDLNSQLDKYRNSTVTYTFGSETQVLDSSIIETWLQITDETITIDQNAVKTYIQELAAEYNTIYVPRTFHTSYGNDVTISNNEYGYQIDQEKELKQLLQDLSAGSAVSREPIYAYSAMQRNGKDDLAGSYIEVSLDNQHLWLYKDGTLITETDIVSGAPKAGRETYRGAWPIPYKASPYNLTSEEYGYNVKVNYWMPFVYGQGLHDASWQSSFGGNRYKNGAGSHGCINLPTDQAAVIYNTIDGGYPIIIY